MKMKYIIIDNGLAEVIIVFPDLVQHGNVAMGFDKVVSAGFIIMTDGNYQCYGSSFSLKINSRPDDTIIANRQLRF